MKKERRRFVRIDKKVLVSYTTLTEAHLVKDEGMALTRDISLKGLQLELPRKPNQGDDLVLSLNIQGQLVAVSGIVAWVESAERGFEIGFEIKQFPKEYTKQIMKLIHENQEKAAD